MNNSKVVIFLGCLFGATLTAPLVTAAGHGGGFSGGGFHGGGGVWGGPFFCGGPGMGVPGRPGKGIASCAGIGVGGPFFPPSVGGMATHPGPITYSPSHFLPVF